MPQVSWVKRVAVPGLLVVLPAAAIAFAVADPLTLTGVLQDFGVAATAPFQRAWLLVRSTGQVRRGAILLLFVVLPVVLLPAYALRPRTGTALLTVLGAVLWLMSGMLMIALRYVD